MFAPENRTRDARVASNLPLYDRGLNRNLRSEAGYAMKIVLQHGDRAP
jgi:hypothetical protein